MDLKTFRILERTGMSFSQWYALPRWERDKWLGRQIQYERKVEDMLDALKDKQGKYSEFKIGAVMRLMLELA